MNDPLSSAIIRGSAAPRDLVARLASDAWIDGWWHRPGVPTPQWDDYVDAIAKRRLRGAQFAEVRDALVVWREDPTERALLGMPVGRIEAVVPPIAPLPILVEDGDDDLPPARLGDDAVAAMTMALQRATANAFTDGLSYLVADVDARAVEQVWAFGRAGFDMIDGTLHFGRRIAGTDHSTPATAVGGVTIEMATPADADDVASAIQFAWDRYHVDPMLPSDGANALYRAWIRQACQGQGTDVAWVARDADGILGFAAGAIDPLARDLLGVPTLQITLASTAPRARRQGIGRALATQAIQWAANEGLSAIDVAASIRNIAAARTYESAGFRLVASRLTMRSWVSLEDASRAPATTAPGPS